MLDRVKNKQILLGEFPWWQMISCLMCAQSVIMIANMVYPDHVDSSGLRADAETGYKVLEALSSRSASAARCVKMIKIMQQTEIESNGIVQKILF
jgi:hypothetical protein